MYDAGINKDQIWIGDVARGTQTRLTSGPGENGTPVWSPDGTRVAFRTDRKHQADIYVRGTSGSAGDEAAHPTSPGRGFRRIGPATAASSSTSIGGRRAIGARGCRSSPWSETGSPSFSIRPSSTGNSLRPSRPTDAGWRSRPTSPAGRRCTPCPFPDAKRKMQISDAGGDSPRWRADGKEVFYVGPGQKP